MMEDTAEKDVPRTHLRGKRGNYDMTACGVPLAGRISTRHLGAVTCLRCVTYPGVTP
jgi:hypothetical protein